MLYDWFVQYIFGASFGLNFDGFVITFVPAAVFSYVMFALFLWASFHLITDIIMAFRAVFGFGYKKRKGGSH